MDENGVAEHLFRASQKMEGVGHALTDIQHLCAGDVRVIPLLRGLRRRLNDVEKNILGARDAASRQGPALTPEDVDGPLIFRAIYSENPESVEYVRRKRDGR